MANEALAQVEELPEAPPQVETEIGRGETWAETLNDIGWEQGDVLVVGSSGIGPVAQVFLGSRATKILRHSPVPVVAVPRGRVEELAHARD
jgi:nucleotide-binding universal stress UspA family protein